MKFSVLIGALLAPLAFSSKLADPVALNKSYNPPLVAPSPVVDFIVDSTTPSQPHRSKRRRALSRFLESHKTSKLRTKSAEETMPSVKVTGKRFGMKFMIGRRSKPATSTTTTIAPTTQTSCSPNSGKLSNAKNWRIWKPVIPKPLCSKTGTGASGRGRTIKLEEIELAMAPCSVLDDTTNRRRSPARFLSIKKKKERAPVDPIPVVAVAADASSILDFDTESDNGTGFSPIATTVVTVPDEIEYADKDTGCFNGQSFLHNVAMPPACQLPELSFTTINWGILESNSDFDISVIQIGAYVEVKVDAAKLVDVESTSETACGLATIHKSFASENRDAAGIMQQPITKSKEKFVATDNSSKLVAMDSKTESTLATPCFLAIENSTAEHNFVADNGLTSGIKEPIRESNEYFVAIDNTAKLVAMGFHSENEVVSAIMEPITESIGNFVAKDDAAKLVALAHTNESPLEIDSIEASIAKDSFDSENTDVSAIMAPFTESIGNFVANDDAAKLVALAHTNESPLEIDSIEASIAKDSFDSENTDVSAIMAPFTESNGNFVANDDAASPLEIGSIETSIVKDRLDFENADVSAIMDQLLESVGNVVAKVDAAKLVALDHTTEFPLEIDSIETIIAKDSYENTDVSAIMEPIMESIGTFVAKDDAGKLVALAHTNESPLEIDSIEASIAKDSFDSENTDTSAIMEPFTESIGNFVAIDDAATPLAIGSIETSIVKDRLDFENADVSAIMDQLLESIGNVVAKVDAAKLVALDHTTEIPEFPLEIDSIETIIAKDSYDSENSDISAIMEPVTESIGNFVAKDDAAKLGALDNTNDFPLEIDSIETSIAKDSFDSENAYVSAIMETITESIGNFVAMDDAAQLVGLDHTNEYLLEIDSIATSRAKDSFDSENAYVSAVMGPITESIGNFVGMDDTAKLVTLNHTDESPLEICAAIRDDAKLDSKIESNLETACVHASMAKDSFASENGDASGFMEPITQSNKQFVAIGDASKLVTVDSTNESTSETACGLAVENGRVNDSFASGNEGASETMKPITESNVVAINTNGMIADEDSAKRVLTTAIQDRQTTFADPTFDVSNKDVTEIPPTLLTDDPSTTHESSNLSEPRGETITSPPNCTSSSSSSIRTNSLMHLENVMDDCLANQNYFPSITVNAAHSETETVLESDAAGETAEETEDDSISLSRFDLTDDWMREQDTNILPSVPVSADEEVDVNGIVATTDGVEDDIPAKAIEQAKEAVGAPEVRKPEKHITRTRLPPRVATARHPKLSSDNSRCRVSTRIFHGSLKDFTVSSMTSPYYYPSPYPSPTVFVWPEMRHAIEFGPWPHFRVSTARVFYMLNMFSPPVRRDLVMDLEPDSYLFTIDHDHESEYGCKLCVEHHDYVRHVSCNYEAMLHDMKSEMFRGGEFGNHKWVYDFTGQMARTEAQIWMRYPGGQYYAF